MISRYYGGIHVWHIDCTISTIRKYKDSIGKKKIYGDINETHY